ncbi:MAG: DOMON-like domain-containing protein [Pseudomonadota bacterium]|nr:DOMON-like domain-containing protein [Pseudomonadota bacterium]
MEAEVARPAADLLALRYVLAGTVAGLRLPPPAPAERADRLWEHSCFEAFVRAPPHPGYAEFNFAPSGRWAAYRFEGYREGMSPAAACPKIAVAAGAERLELAARVALPADASWLVGLAAVVEEADGNRSFWALDHPPGAPDFHHPACFVLELPPPAAG